jgi:hypothetical protein
MTTHDSFVANVQGKLPCAKLILQKKPGPLFDWQSCALTAINMDDPSKTFTMTFDEGLDEEPTDEVVNSFVDNAILVLKG